MNIHTGTDLPIREMTTVGHLVGQLESSQVGERNQKLAIKETMKLLTF